MMKETAEGLEEPTAEVVLLPAERIESATRRFEESLKEAGHIAQLKVRTFLNENEAVALGYFTSSASARALRAVARGPVYYKKGKAIRYKAEDLEAWFESGKMRTTQSEGIG
jgi:hypothetical protein